MVVVYTDGSTLECSRIEICGNDLYCDDYRIVPICDVDHIEESED